MAEKLSGAEFKKEIIPISFETEGSNIRSIRSIHTIYRYDNEGKTTRFDVISGEQYDRGDITIFIDLTPKELKTALDCIYHQDYGKNRQELVFLIERSGSDRKNIKKREDVENPDNLSLAFFDFKKKPLFVKKVSLTPVVGYFVLNYQNDNEAIPKHLGQRVTKIN